MALEFQHPDRIGPYEVIRVLGRGGAGTVFLVKQEEPVSRLAALKLLRLEMHNREMLARFTLESKVLAMMNHPNIAKVFDVGETPTAGPYIVLEYVEGLSIIEFCDAERLGVTERLRLFVTVCRAVQHAHQVGVLHRDIKPSNVLVTAREGEEPFPVIIDFGLARVEQEGDEGDVALTKQGQPLGTPQYMSPEQLELPPDAIDARTDVYSLGVLLFELAVGVVPHERKYSSLRPGELLDGVKKEESTKPSTKLTKLAAETTEIASNRRTDRKALLKELRGDLDWIAMKALERHRARRYATASELAQDVERYLAKEPIIARPPSSAYRFERFVARNRAAIIVGVVFVLAMVIGSGASTFLYMKAGRSWQATARASRIFETVRHDVAGAHLWFEEALANDPTRDLERDVRRPLRDALQSVEAVLGQDAVGEQTLLIQNETAEKDARLLRDRLVLLTEITTERWDKREEDGATGGTLDQTYDEVYEEIQDLSSGIILLLQREAVSDWRQSARIGVIANAIGLVVIVVSILFGLRVWSKRI